MKLMLEIAVALAIIVGLMFIVAAWLERGDKRERQRELERIEYERRALINSAAWQGVTVSTDKVLKHVVALREKYRTSGQEEAAREIERIIDEFREQNGLEISVDKAYAFMKEIERNYGQ